MWSLVATCVDRKTETLVKHVGDAVAQPLAHSTEWTGVKTASNTFDPTSSHLLSGISVQPMTRVRLWLLADKKRVTSL